MASLQPPPHAPSRSRVRAALPLLAALFALHALVSCEADAPAPTDECPSVCPCSEDGCPAGVCGVRLTLSESCAVSDPRVEVFVAGCLEPTDLTTDAPRVACGAIPAGRTGQVVARGATTQWGPYELECPEGGGLSYPVELKCPAE